MRTAYSHAYNTNMDTSLRASHYTYGNPPHSDTILIPILKQPNQIMHANNAAHYIIGVFNTKTGTLFHFDPFGTDASAMDKRHYRDAILTLRPQGEPNFICKRIINRVKETYNQHPNVSMSGFYIALIAELILLRDYEHIYLKRLSSPLHMNAEHERQIRRICNHLTSIANGAFPTYTAPPKTQRRMPTDYWPAFPCKQSRIPAVGCSYLMEMVDHK